MTGIKQYTGGPGEDSVFKLTLAGLEDLLKNHSDMEVMTAACAIAEGNGGFSTDERETAVDLKIGKNAKQIVVSNNTAKAMKLVITWLVQQKVIAEADIPEDRFYTSVGKDVADNVSFLSGQSDSKKETWASNYNSGLSKAIAAVEKRLVRTWGRWTRKEIFNVTDGLRLHEAVVSRNQKRAKGKQKR